MKALLMFGDNLIKTEYLERATPEIKIPIRRVFNVAWMQEPSEANLHKSNFIAFIFKCVQPGEKYSIYELDGFDNLNEA